uniref:USP domain-containing protein n=1 Tax=Panagrolaimus sp. JU765 TaxID=591449 RepID=A0AC34REW5_9BILA
MAGKACAIEDSLMEHENHESSDPMDDSASTHKESKVISAEPENSRNPYDYMPKPAKGLQNLGNTCFYNSTMQCLMHTHALYKWLELVTEKEKLVIKRGNVTVNEKKVEVPNIEIALEHSQMPLVHALQHFLLEFRHGKGPNPSPLFGAIAQKAPRFRGWQQQDAHELLRYLLDGIRTEELKRFKEAIEKHIKIEDKEERHLVVRAYLKSTENCYVDSIFGGNLLQMIKCCKCGHVSNSLEPFLDLSLPLNYNEIPATAADVPPVPPRNRREETPKKLSKHQLKQAKKREKKEARRLAKLGAKLPNGGITESTNDVKMEENGENQEDDMEMKAIDDSASESSENESEDGQQSIEESTITNGNDSTETAAYNETLVSSPTGDFTTRTLENSMRHFTAAEKLCASNAYECEHCCAPHNKKLPANSKEKKTVEATKQYLIYSPPCVLTIHLKRFEQVPIYTGYNRFRTKKIRGNVDFPFVLNLAPFCAKNGQRINPGQDRVMYSLYGVVVHSGDLGGGHYIAFVKSRQVIESLSAAFMKLGLRPDHLPATADDCANGFPKYDVNANETAEKTLRDLDDGSKWYYCSDSHVREVDVKEVERTEAYIFLILICHLLSPVFFVLSCFVSFQVFPGLLIVQILVQSLCSHFHMSEVNCTNFLMMEP